MKRGNQTLATGKEGGGVTLLWPSSTQENLRKRGTETFYKGM